MYLRGLGSTAKVAPDVAAPMHPAALAWQSKKSKSESSIGSSNRLLIATSETASEPSSAAESGGGGVSSPLPSSSSSSSSNSGGTGQSLHSTTSPVSKSVISEGTFDKDHAPVRSPPPPLLRGGIRRAQSLRKVVEADDDSIETSSTAQFSSSRRLLVVPTTTQSAFPVDVSDKPRKYSSGSNQNSNNNSTASTTADNSQAVTSSSSSSLLHTRPPSNVSLHSIATTDPSSVSSSHSAGGRRSAQTQQQQQQRRQQQQSMGSPSSNDANSPYSNGGGGASGTATPRYGTSSRVPTASSTTGSGIHGVSIGPDTSEIISAIYHQSTGLIIGGDETPSSSSSFSQSSPSASLLIPRRRSQHQRPQSRGSSMVGGGGGGGNHSPLMQSSNTNGSNGAGTGLGAAEQHSGQHGGGRTATSANSRRSFTRTNSAGRNILSPGSESPGTTATVVGGGGSLVTIGGGAGGRKRSSILSALTSSFSSPDTNSGSNNRTNNNNNNSSSSRREEGSVDASEARQRWKEGIITVMAANRFIHAAESRRERLASQVADEARRAETARRNKIFQERRAAAARNQQHSFYNSDNTGIFSSLFRNLPVKQAMDRMLHGWTTPSRINSYLWIGGLDDAADLERLSSLGITHVLNSAKQAPDVHVQEFIYLHVNLLDHPEEDISSAFEQSFAHIADAKENGGQVLVHCVAGMSRSVAIAAAWLVRHEGVTLKQAMDLIRHNRPIALPNVGFRMALIRDELAIAGATSVAGVHHDPLWNFSLWRNEENKFPRRVVTEATSTTTQSTRNANGEPVDGASPCCSIM